MGVYPVCCAKNSQLILFCFFAVFLYLYLRSVFKSTPRAQNDWALVSRKLLNESCQWQFPFLLQRAWPWILERREYIHSVCPKVHLKTVFAFSRKRGALTNRHGNTLSNETWMPPCPPLTTHYFSIWTAISTPYEIVLELTVHRGSSPHLFGFLCHIPLDESIHWHCLLQTRSLLHQLLRQAWFTRLPARRLSYI